MIPLALDIGPSELLIILAVILVLFGGSRLAGLGKSAGRAIKEFKDETAELTTAEQRTRATPDRAASDRAASEASAAAQSPDAGPGPSTAPTH